MHALAQASSSHSGTNWSTLLFLLPLLLLVWLFWMQRKRQQQMRSAQRQIEVGEDVSTTSGLYGRLVALDDEVGTLEIAPGVQVRFDRRAIVPRTQVQATRGTAAEPAANVDLHKDDEPETKAG